jgi:hypothetical protein
MLTAQDCTLSIQNKKYFYLLRWPESSMSICVLFFWNRDWKPPTFALKRCTQPLHCTW